MPAGYGVLLYGCDGGMMPRSRATRAAWVRLVTPSFWKISLIRLPIVFSERWRRGDRAILKANGHQLQNLSLTLGQLLVLGLPRAETT
jgi:hypothetical protein